MEMEIQLKERGYEILCCDHHEADKYSDDAVVINNQLSQNYENKMLCGAGVLYKFFEYCEEKDLFPKGSINYYLDLVAFACISDMMEMSTLEIVLFAIMAFLILIINFFLLSSNTN